jgi:hypothetical protein
MKRLHLIIGLVLVIVFLLTGQYMDRFLNHLRGMPDGPRMLYRTRHIFILLSGLLQLALGSYFSYRSQLGGRVLQVLGSVMITVASILFVIAFFYEPRLTGLYTPLSHKGMYLIAIGTLLHLLSGINDQEKTNTLKSAGARCALPPSQPEN